MAAFQAGELNGVDCSSLYHDVKRILNTFTNKPIHTNFTKSEHLALENLRKDKDCIIVTADKGVALIVMDDTSYFWFEKVQLLSSNLSLPEFYFGLMF